MRSFCLSGEPRNHQNCIQTINLYFLKMTFNWAKKKASLNLAPKPKGHVSWFHLNASALRGLSKLIIQISCKKLNSRKLQRSLGVGVGGLKFVLFIYLWEKVSNWVSLDNAFFLTWRHMKFSSGTASGARSPSNFTWVGSPTFVYFSFLFPNNLRLFLPWSVFYWRKHCLPTFQFFLNPSLG